MSGETVYVADHRIPGLCSPGEYLVQDRTGAVSLVIPLGAKEQLRFEANKEELRLVSGPGTRRPALTRLK